MLDRTGFRACMAAVPALCALSVHAVLTSHQIVSSNSPFDSAVWLHASLFVVMANISARVLVLLDLCCTERNPNQNFQSRTQGQSRSQSR